MLGDPAPSKLGIIIQDRIFHTYISISSGHRQSPFSPFALDVMDAIGLPYHQRKMDQYWELQAYAKGLLPLPTMEPPLSKNPNFSTFSGQLYEYESITRFYSFLLDNRTIMRTAHAAAKYRRQFGDLPETMEALVPEFLPEIPKSVRNEEPIQYLLSPQLLSLGWPPTKGDYESATWMKLDRRLPPYPLATALPDLPREEGSPFGPRFW